MTYLDEIVEYKRAHRGPVPSDLDRLAADAPPSRSLLRSLGTYRAFLIAECKQASPSRGMLTEHYDPVSLARIYEANGAAAISVLTDKKFFGGSLEHLVEVRRAVDAPVLRKDFTLDERDLLEARAFGADLVLLIAAILTDAELCRLLEVSIALSMETIVEVHDESEVDRALAAGAQIVGINNRDLHAFRTDLGVTERLLPMIPSQVVTVSESGIFTAEQVHRLQTAGARGVLLGEALIRAPDTGALVRELVEACCPDCWRERDGNRSLEGYQGSGAHGERAGSREGAGGIVESRGRIADEEDSATGDQASRTKRDTSGVRA